MVSAVTHSDICCICGMVRIVKVDEEVERTLQERLTRNRNLVDIKVDALLRRVESMVGECLVVDTAATAQDTLRSFHSTGRAAMAASTTAAAGARVLCNNYLLLLPKELLDQVRPMAITTAVLRPGVRRLTGTAFGANAGDAVVAVSDSDSRPRRRAVPSP
jgi:hypothetical protein